MHFTQAQRDEYRLKMFEWMAGHFERALADMGKFYPDIAASCPDLTGWVERRDGEHFIAFAKRSKPDTIRCTIRTGGEMFKDKIAIYATSGWSDGGTWDESFVVDADHWGIFLREDRLTFRPQRGGKRFGDEEIVERCWQMFACRFGSIGDWFW